MKKLLWIGMLSAFPLIANANCDPNGKFDLNACRNDAASTKFSHQPRTGKHDDGSAEKDYLRAQRQRCMDRECSMELYRPIAEKGYAPAQVELADRYLTCSRDDRRCDVRQGLYWMEKAAKQGWARAESKMGDFYLFGLNEGRVRNTVENKVVVVAQDYDKARGWYEKAAAQDYPDALLQLGQIYEQGLGVKTNKKQARRYYEQLAKQGNIEGQKRLAVLDGKPLPQEPQPQQYIYNPPPLIQANCVKMNPVNGTPIYLYGPTLCVGCQCAF